MAGDSNDRGLWNMLERWLGGIDEEEGFVCTAPLLRAILFLAPIAVLGSFGRFAAHEFIVVAAEAVLVLAASALVLQWLAALSTSTSRIDFVANRWAWTVGVFGVIALAVAVGLRTGRAEPIFWVLGTWVLGTALLRAFMAVLRAPVVQRRPAIGIVVTFVVMIFVGTVLLFVLPVTEEGELGLMDALFTATSATCVTGLEVVPTGTTFNRFGQGIILGLIQVGGLGIMALGTFLILIVGQRLSLPDRIVMREALNVEEMGGLGRLVGALVGTTLICEAIGAVLLYSCFDHDVGGPLAWFDAGFHAVSAFCNAGFSLNADSLEGYAGHFGANAVIMALVILGGLGFTVNRELLGQLFRRRGSDGRRRLSLHTRLVLWASLVLVVAGAVVFFVLDRNASLEGRDPSEAALVSTFQSVSARTAGFSTVSFDAGSEDGTVAPATRFLFTAFMFIGASPGGTGGGLKTVTFVILILALVAVLRQRDHVEIFGRRLAPALVRRAVAVAVLYGMMVFFGTAMLILTDGSRFSLDALMFESVSALATVGFSAGVSSSDTLSDGGKFVLVFLMFAGRVGPLTLVFITSGARPDRGIVEYPEEKVMIG